MMVVPVEKTSNFGGGSSWRKISNLPNPNPVPNSYLTGLIFCSVWSQRGVCGLPVWKRGEVER